MFTMFQLAKVLETLTIKKPETPKYILYSSGDEELINKKHTPPRKLQRSPKIVDPDRYNDSDLDQPLLPSLSFTEAATERSCNNNTNKSNNNENKKGNVRVKVLMTKKEAAILLSKCQDNKEGTLEFNDVISELVNLPSHRINVVSFANSCRDMALATIPEESDEENFVIT